MFAEVFKFLFKYQPLVFEQGKFVLGASRSMSLVVVAAGVAALYVLWTYRQLGALPIRDRVVLLALRIGLFAVVLFALLRPTLLLKIAVPQQNFVGILLDDSRSMQIADEQNKPRSEFIKDQFARTDGPLLAALGKRFQLKIFRFSSHSEHLQSSGDLTFEGTGTHYGEALDRAREELSGLPVAGLIVAGDGADNSDATLDQAIAGLKSQAMPVFPIGVGRERLARDVQVTRAETPRRVLKGSNLVVDVVIAQTGYAGAKVPLIVEDAGRMVSTQDITLPRDGESATVHVRFMASETGPRVFRFRVPVQGNEEVVQNNQRDTLVEVYDRRERVLYLEGQPRPEMKFVLQATKDDNNVRVAVLQRTAEDKYYRLNVENSEELQNGFPTTREELFGYSGIILGSAEASAFTPVQQRMLEDFVDVRGGGLLALGGLLSFGEGGWAGTPLAQALPIVIAPPSIKTDEAVEQIVRPTRTGLNHPAIQIVDKEDQLEAKWRELPLLTTVNPVFETKPGATVLLTGLDPRNRDHVVLAYQRYGRGKSMAFTVQDSWQWRMGQKMAVTDTTHHTFWDRLVRWLVDGAPDKVMVSATPDKVQKGEPVTLTADVVDPEYKGIDNGHITARVTSPSGKVEDVPMEWSVKRPGEYTGRYTPDVDGLFKVRVGGTHDAKDVGTGDMTLRVAPSDAEYFDAAMRAPLLKRIADETSGRFYKADDTKTLVDAITYSGRGITVTEDRELWDMPIVLLLLLGMMGGEWAYRRSRGLA